MPPKNGEMERDSPLHLARWRVIVHFLFKIENAAVMHLIKNAQFWRDGTRSSLFDQNRKRRGYALN